MKKKITTKNKGEETNPKKKRQHVYQIIVKVDSDKFVKYNSSNLLSFVEFLDKQYPKWRFFNVFYKKTREQIGSFTNKNRPQTRFIAGYEIATMRTATPEEKPKINPKSYDRYDPRIGTWI